MADKRVLVEHKDGGQSSLTEEEAEMFASRIASGDLVVVEAKKPKASDK